MGESVIRKNSVLARDLGDHGVEFISFVAGSIQRILPHVIVDPWREGPYKPPGSFWASTARTHIRLTISFGDAAYGRSISTLVHRRGGDDGRAAKKTLDDREYDICRKISDRSIEIARDFTGAPFIGRSPETTQALRTSFDEVVIARHLESHFELKMPVAPIFSALRRMSEQTYENKALVFGCLLGGLTTVGGQPHHFPYPFLNSKKYKALSDGFRTSYDISTDGQIVGFIDLAKFDSHRLTEKHYYPDWAAELAQASLSGRCAIALTRQGDILVFDRGVLRFTYRFGQWQYWNHAHVVRLLHDQTRAQHVRPEILGRVVGAIYRSALDVSFRRSGGLFVILKNRTAIHDIVRQADAIGDAGRSRDDEDFDVVVQQHKIQSLPRSVAAELASLDGAIVLANSGQILAYGAVLQPRKSGRIRGTEGSRTKAAIGAHTTDWR